MTGEEMQGSKYASLNEVLQDYLQEYQKNRPELNGKDTGIEILKVFVEIPKLNKQVEDNYQMIATQKTAEEAERYRQLTLLKEKETRNKVEILEAEKVRDVAILKNQELIFKEEAEAKIAKIRAESAAEQKRMNADAESYAAHKKAQDNQLLLTKEYLQIKQLEYYGCQNTIHYGDGPKFLITPPLQGAVPIAVAAAAAA
jgi:regulator of protease activity HflC (stomatin/prohibitin superfamily)